MHRALRGSTVVRIARNSRVAALIARVRESLAGSPETDEDEQPTESDPDESMSSSTADGSTAGLLAGSLLAGFLARGSAWIRGSWLYRWLTDEPDPDVIVIDLRETRIVGPILRVLDWFLSRFSDGSGGSLLVRAARRGYHLTVGRPVQVLGACLGAGALALLSLVLVTGAASTRLFAVAAVLAVGAALASRVDSSWADLRETRLVELLVAAFEPPEPPMTDEDNQQDDER